MYGVQKNVLNYECGDGGCRAPERAMPAWCPSVGIPRDPSRRLWDEQEGPGNWVSTFS